MQSKRGLGKAAALLLLAGVIGGIQATAEAAEGKSPNFELEPVVVAATATPNLLNKANASVTVITKEEIETYHYKTLSEVIQHVSGVNSVVFADGAGFEISGESSLALRGSTNCLVAVDGVVQKTGNSYKTYLLNMNMEDIERVEVLRGSASTLYGADAVGGVINIITKRDYEGAQSKITTAVGSFGTRNYHLNTSGSEDNVFWALSYDKAKKGNYDDGYGKSTPRDISADTLDLKFGIRLNEETDFIFKYQNNLQDGRAAYIHPNQGIRLWDAAYHFQTLTGMLDYKRQDGKEANSLAILYGRMNSDRSRSTVFNGPAVPWEKVERDNISITNRYYKQVDDNNRIAAGFEWQRYSVATAANPDREIRETAVYIQDEWDITKRLKFTGGLRYVTSNGYQSRFLDSANLAYSVADNVTMYVSSSEFYQTPSTTAIFGSAAFLPNPQIKPESGRNNEIGFHIGLDKKTRLDMALFDRVHSNAIVIEDLPGPLNQYKNIDGASHVKGSEINFEKELGKYFRGKIGFSRLIADEDSQIPRLPKTQYAMTLNYNRDKYDIGLQALHRSDFAPNNYFPAGTRALPEENYWVWNVSANYRTTDNSKLFFKVNNIFDKGYMSATQYTAQGALIDEPFVYLTAPGRSFMLGVEYTF